MSQINKAFWGIILLFLSHHVLAHAEWQELEPGLELGVFSSPIPSTIGDSLIHLLRIDVGRFDLTLLNASAPEQGNVLTARQWSRRHGLIAAINASMYQTDFKTSVSYMRTRNHINNPWLSKDKSVLAFDRAQQTAPPVKMIDRECESFDAWRQTYQTFVQSIRMISCRRRNVWAQQSKRWSIAAIGIDGGGRILFIHSRSPYSTHDLINILLTLPIDIRQAMYAEGGAEAQLYINSKGHEYEFTGIRDASAANAQDHNAWPIPNIVGVVRRQ